MRLTAIIKKEENWYVARCIEMDVVSQGKTIEEAKKNLQEAIELYLESFGMDENIYEDDVLVCSFEVTDV